MPLRDVSEFQAWVDREAPSPIARTVARTYIAELGDQPWRAPSVPIAELSNQPEYVEPHGAARRVYDDVYPEYLGLYTDLRERFAALAQRA